VDIGASGGISASLLIWPALFHPRPQGVKRQLDVILLYTSFIGSFIGLSITGALLKNLLVNLSDGKVLHWLENQLLSMLLVSVVALILSAFYRSTFRRIFVDTDK
jgi:H+/Cl- antiporter ClcA